MTDTMIKLNEVRAMIAALEDQLDQLDQHVPVRPAHIAYTSATSASSVTHTHEDTNEA